MEITFGNIEFGDQKDIVPILAKEKSNSFSKAFGSYYLWGEKHKTKILINDGILYVKYDFDEPKYEMPKGAESDHELKKALEFVFEDAKKLGLESSFKFTRLLAGEAEKLEELFPKKFHITPIRDDFEYIYRSEDLANLKGKRYHSKRNHIAQFTKKIDWRYEAMNMAQKDRYSLFFDEWFKVKGNGGRSEQFAINKALKFYSELDMDGGVVIIDDKIVACTMGEKINSDTFLVHFEKALPEFADAYAVINNEFSKCIAEKGYKFVNREEDLGLEGLRKAKLSYHPYTLIEKYDAEIRKI